MLLTQHIGEFVSEKNTVEQKYPDPKSVNIGKNYIENEYNSYLLRIRSTQLKYESSYLCLGGNI